MPGDAGPEPEDTLRIIEEETVVPEPRPADKDYTAVDGHRYENSPQYVARTGQWYFSSAHAVHSHLCPCHTDPDFY